MTTHQDIIDGIQAMQARQAEQRAKLDEQHRAGYALFQQQCERIGHIYGRNRSAVENVADRHCVVCGAQTCSITFSKKSNNTPINYRSEEYRADLRRRVAEAQKEGA